MVSEVVEHGDHFYLLGAGTGQAPADQEVRAGVEETTYEYRIFLPRCEVYAFRLAGPEVTGVYGPLEFDEGLLSALPNYPYEEQLDNVVWVNFNLNEFVSCNADFDTAACECEGIQLRM